MFTLVAFLGILFGFGERAQHPLVWEDKLALCVNLVCDPVIIWITLMPPHEKTSTILIMGILAALADAWAIFRLLYQRQLKQGGCNDSQTHNLIRWAVWGALQMGIVMIHLIVNYMNAERSQVGVAPAHALLWCLLLFPLLCSVLVRWILLLRARTPWLALIWFCVGLILAESSYLLGLVLLPGHKNVLFMLSFLGILQFMPLFRRRS
jgi:hypothetical protein